jgi:hypothetical protein
VKEGKILAQSDPSLCPGHEDDLVYIQEMTTAAATWRQEREEEKRLSRAVQRTMEQETNLQGKIQNRVEREQEELAILLHNRKMRAQRKENKRLGKLARAWPKPV